MPITTYAELVQAVSSTSSGTIELGHGDIQCDDEIVIDRSSPENQGYVTDALNGVWARAPYLHNGSATNSRAPRAIRASRPPRAAGPLRAGRPPPSIYRSTASAITRSCLAEPSPRRVTRAQALPIASSGAASSHRAFATSHGRSMRFSLPAALTRRVSRVSRSGVRRRSPAPTRTSTRAFARSLPSGPSPPARPRAARTRKRCRGSRGRTI